jgi:N-acyl-D-aspartate/D-glutamate deacylase
MLCYDRWHASYEPAAIPADKCLARVAEQSGRAPQDVAYDWMCEEECEASLWSPMFGADRDGTLDNTRTMLLDPDCTPGFGDAGAHVTMLTDATAQTHTLTYWVRDRTVGTGPIPLEAAVHAITLKNARLFGLADRGTLEAGKRADLNVIDLQRLDIKPPRFKRDLA